MPSIHREINFEREICGSLAARGWLCDAGNAVHHDPTAVTGQIDVRNYRPEEAPAECQ